MTCPDCEGSGCQSCANFGDCGEHECTDCDTCSGTGIYEPDEFNSPASLTEDV